MSENRSKGKDFGIEPMRGKGGLHFRFHGGPQSRVNRVVILGTGTFVELQKGVEDLLGDQSDAVFYDAGIRSGKEARETIEKELSEKGDVLVRKAFSLLEENGLGWFRIKDLKIDSKKKRGSITVSHSFIADTYGKAGKPVCHFIAGFIAGVIFTIWKVEVVCEETSCSAVEGDDCVFVWEIV